MQEAQDDPAYLRGQAERCRRLADAVTDQASIDALRKLAEQFDAQAESAEARALKHKPRPPLEG